MLELVQEIGAAAGFAAGIGLPLLAALHRSQARDVRRLRERVTPRQTAVTPPRRSRPGAVALVGLLVLGAASYGVTQHRPGDAPASKDHAVPTKPKRTVPAVKPGNVTVAVLNGTTVPGLAAALREEIAAAGFKKGIIDVFADQQLVESVVQYAPGRQAEAKAVGRTLGISQSEPVAADSLALAGDATVIVIAGIDKAP